MTLGFSIEQLGENDQARMGRLGAGGTTRVGPQGIVRRLEGVGARGRDFSSTFERIHRSFLAAERSRFASGAGWAPDSADWVARKTARGLDPRTMRSTGELERALTTGRGVGAVKEIGPHEATFGTDLERAVFSQRGSGTRRRRVLVINHRRRMTWLKMVRDHLMGEGP